MTEKAKPSKRTLVAAWTGPGSVDPKYVNITHVDGEDGGLEITVRSPKDLGATTSVCRVPAGPDLKRFVTELLSGLAKVGNHTGLKAEA